MLSYHLIFYTKVEPFKYVSGAVSDRLPVGIHQAVGPCDSPIKADVNSPVFVFAANTSSPITVGPQTKSTQCT